MQTKRTYRRNGVSARWEEFLVHVTVSSRCSGHLGPRERHLVPVIVRARYKYKYVEESTAKVSVLTTVEQLTVILRTRVVCELISLIYDESESNQVLTFKNFI